MADILDCSRPTDDEPELRRGEAEDRATVLFEVFRGVIGATINGTGPSMIEGMASVEKITGISRRRTSSRESREEWKISFVEGGGVQKCVIEEPGLYEAVNFQSIEISLRAFFVTDEQGGIELLDDEQVDAILGSEDGRRAHRTERVSPGAGLEIRDDDLPPCVDDDSEEARLWRVRALRDEIETRHAGLVAIVDEDGRVSERARDARAELLSILEGLAEELEARLRERADHRGRGGQIVEETIARHSATVQTALHHACTVTNADWWLARRTSWRDVSSSSSLKQRFAVARRVVR
jgi:hypothetical protein